MNMNVDLLWDIIDESQEKSGGDLKKQLGEMDAKISNYTQDEIFQSAVIFYQELTKGYLDRMVFAGRFLNGFCAWEELDMFLAWIMAKGRISWNRVLRNPDEGLSLLITEGMPRGSFLSNEFLNLCWQAYYKKIGMEPGMDEDIDVEFGEAVMGDSYNIDTESLFGKLSPDLNQAFPKLLDKVSWRDNSSTKTYKRYWAYGGDGELVEGEIWQLFVDAPYAYRGSPAGLGYIPPYQVVKEFFQSGGGPGGMGPGCAWTPFILTKEEYDKMKAILLKMNTTPLKEEHFYIPKEGFLIDKELNQNYPSPKEWHEAFNNKYK